LQDEKSQIDGLEWLAQLMELTAKAQARKIVEWLTSKWAYDIAQGTPVFSVRLKDWEQFRKEIGL